MCTIKVLSALFLYSSFFSFLPIIKADHSLYNIAGQLIVFVLKNSFFYNCIENNQLY